MSSKNISKSKQFNKIKPPLTEAEAKRKKRKKRIIIAIIVILILIGAGVAVYFIFFHHPNNDQKSEEKSTKIYSRLSGLEIQDESENSLPTYCMQIPNGTDGARPQVGLNQAPVVFEAIAEAGITRFAAVFQNPTSKTLGPIRSLRSYYLDWDTPFDCTIVHAGGSPEALQELASGDYRDLTESNDYMWRDTSGYWAPNNLMTSPSLLDEFANKNNYKKSDPKVLPRLTPDEVEKTLSDIKAETSSDSENKEDSADKDNKPATKLASEFNINFGTTSDFNTVYKYDETSNTYLRSYANGEAHLVYSCEDSTKTNPAPKSDCGIAKQVAPSAVAVMMVDEHLDSDGYHHVIQTIGTGIAYVFQNGTVTKGTWKKSSKSAQIEFRDSANNTISFTPGQLWIAAVPNSGGLVKY